MTNHTRPNEFVRLIDIDASIQQDLRYYGTNNFLGTPVDGYLAPQAWLTRPAALALSYVQQSIRPWNLSLYIFDAYRPQRAVQHFLHWITLPEAPALRQRFHPTYNKSSLFSEGYLAKHSSHTRGSTVDLSLATWENGHWQELDMGTEFDFFSEKAAPDYPDLNAQQRANRLLLRNIMYQQGFVGFGLEWWHFTLANEPFPQQYFDFPITEQ